MRRLIIAAMVFAGCCGTATGQAAFPLSVVSNPQIQQDQSKSSVAPSVDDTRAFHVRTFPWDDMTSVTLPDGSRAELGRHFCQVDPLDGGWDCTIHYCIPATNDISGSIGKVFYSHSRMWPSDYAVGGLYHFNSFVSGYRVFVTVGICSETYSCGIHFNTASCNLYSYDFRSRNLRTLVSTEESGWFLPNETPYGGVDACATYGMPLTALAPPVDSTMLVLWRRQGSYRTGMSEKRMQFRVLKEYSTSGDSLGDVLLDSIPGASTNLTDHIVAGYTNDLYILRCVIPGDTIIAERFLLNGHKLYTVRTDIIPLMHRPMQRYYSAEFFEATEIVPQNIHQYYAADFDVRNISGERFAVTYTRVDSHSKQRTYTALFDKNFLPLGPPQSTGIDPYDGTDDVTRKMPSEEPAPGEDDFTLSPNPCRGATTMRYSLRECSDGSSTTVTLYDALGRSIHSFTSQTLSASTGAVQLDLSGLPAGIYHVVLTRGVTVLRKSLILLRR